MSGRHRRARDLPGAIAAVVAVLLVCTLVAAQVLLASPAWRPRLSLADAMEGISLDEARLSPSRDLPSVGLLW
ncbi:MAG: hypothetical protein ACM3X6_00550 [Patescibacteria group bacterium]